MTARYIPTAIRIRSDGDSCAALDVPTFPDPDGGGPDPDCPWCGSPSLGTCTCSLLGPLLNPLFVTSALAGRERRPTLALRAGRRSKKGLWL